MELPKKNSLCTIIYVSHVSVPTPAAIEFGKMMRQQWESTFGPSADVTAMPTAQQRWNEALFRCLFTRYMETWSKRGFQSRGVIAPPLPSDPEHENLVMVGRHQIPVDDGFSSSAIKKEGMLSHGFTKSK